MKAMRTIRCNACRMCCLCIQCTRPARVSISSHMIRAHWRDSPDAYARCLCAETLVSSRYRGLLPPAERHLSASLAASLHLASSQPLCWHPGANMHESPGTRLPGLQLVSRELFFGWMVRVTSFFRRRRRAGPSTSCLADSCLDACAGMALP